MEKDFDGTQEVTRQMLVVLDRERDFRKFCGWKKIIVVTILIGMTAALSDRAESELYDEEWRILSLEGRIIDMENRIIDLENWQRWHE